MEGSGSFLGAGCKAKGKHRGCVWNRKQKKKVLSVVFFFLFSCFRCERLLFYAESRDYWRGKRGTHRGERRSREVRPLRG